MAGPARTILDVFRTQVRVHAERPALRRKVDGWWEVLDWSEYGRAVREVTAALVELGVEPGDRVGLLSLNRVEWVVADLGVLGAGAVTVPVYPTSAAGQIAYVLADSGAKVCIVEDREQLAKVVDERASLPALEHVVCFERLDAPEPSFSTFDAMRALGAERLQREPGLFDARAGAVGPEDLATLVYTSGTTGPPKGAMITHGNVIATVGSITRVVPIGPDDRFLSFLPLSHIAERAVSHFGQVVAGGETWFARSFQTVADDLLACRPTIFFAVPRVWEKLNKEISEQLDHTTGLARVLADRYFSLAPSAVAAEQGAGRQAFFAHLVYRALDCVVGARIRRATGLDRARVLVSGAAPIDADLLRWLHGIGLRVGEVYGQTEDCGPTSLNPPGRIRIGTVGPPLPGVRVRIADDGEILVRGPNVCRGYWRNDEGTRELLDADGWMHSGDLGHLDAFGYLVVTGRKKDLIITAHGKNIAPQEIETALVHEPLIGQAVVVGDGRPYLTALLTLDTDALHAWAEDRGTRAPPEVLVDDPALRAEVAAEVERVNARLAHVETIKRWHVLPREFSINEGELTPSLKVCRNMVAERYAREIATLYDEPTRGVAVVDPAV